MKGMWEDIVIGSGTKGSSASHVFEIEGDHSISQNRCSFWISDCVLGVGMTIFKDTEEGKYLSKLIEEKTPLHRIQEWLDQVVLRNISVTDFRVCLANTLKETFRAGQSSKAKEIRTTLGL